MTDIVRPEKYSKDEIKGLVEKSNYLVWESQVNQDTIVDFLDKLPSGSINLDKNGNIASLGDGKKPLTEFVDSVKRVMTSEGITDFSAKPDDKIMHKAMKNFVNVDLSKYASNGEHVITGNDLSTNLISYMNDNKKSLNAHPNFNPNMISAVMATYVEELPENIGTKKQKQDHIDKMVPYLAGKLSKLSVPFGKDADAKTLKYNNVLLADEKQKSIVLGIIRDSSKELQGPKYEGTKDPRTLELLGKESMKGEKSILKTIKTLFMGETNTERAEIYKSYKKTTSTSRSR